MAGSNYVFEKRKILKKNGSAQLVKKLSLLIWCFCDEDVFGGMIKVFR